MAEGFLKSLDKNLQVFSAGTFAQQNVNPHAIKAMAEIGIDISENVPKNVKKFLNENFDFVVTVCDGAKEICPNFTGNVKHRFHIGFEDPASAEGTENEILSVYRKVRDEICEQFKQFYLENLRDIKEIVKEKYREIALQSQQENETSCCGSGTCCNIDYVVFSENYEKLQGYNAAADLGLGCGLPTEFAQIKKGDTVIDLGSGAGNDCFVARAIVGEEGLVIGVDMTEAMILKAKTNAEKLGYKNVQFRLGDIEKLPVTANKADVVVSNCVLNLVPDKEKAFSEIFRVLKLNGHFSISDVVLVGNLPAKLANAAAMYAGCVAGAMQKNDYLEIIEKTGFKNIQIQKEKQIHIPDEVLLNFLSNDELENFKKSNVGIFSITVYAKKQKCCCC